MSRPSEKRIALVILLGLGLFSATIYQNCAPANFVAESKKSSVLGGPVDPSSTPPPTVTVCEGISCDLTPLTNVPAVTTILIALGDESNNQLVVNGASSQLIAESLVRYTSPKVKPKILLVHDYNSGAESPTDYAYIASLLNRYDVKTIDEPQNGLSDADVAGYDIVWLNNPGYPAHSAATRDVLIGFSGGVIISGDDMSQGTGFDMSALTGLNYVDNGTSVRCGANSHYIDDNVGGQYKVSIAADKIPSNDANALNFNYGNDIDNTTAGRSDLEVLAQAKGDFTDCTALRPAIVRYVKPLSPRQ